MALTIVEMACQKTVANAPVIGITKIVYFTQGSSGYAYWTCDLDGSNSKKIPITLPAGSSFAVGINKAAFQRSVDGQLLIFGVIRTIPNAEVMDIYTFKLDGTELRRIKTARDPASIYTFFL